MNILYITPYLPIFGSHGCSAKNLDDIELLALKHTLHIVCFATPADRKNIASFQIKNCQLYPFFVKTYQYLPRRQRQMSKLIKYLLEYKRVDILQCECSFMSRYLPAIEYFPSLLTEHQVYWIHFWREFKIKKNPFLLLRVFKNIFEEKKWLPLFKKVIFFSQNDKNLFQFLMTDKDKTRIIPMGIDAEYYSSNGLRNFQYDACFLGNFGCYPNEDAIFYFMRQILPVLKKIFPNFSLLLIGKNPSQRLKKIIERENITLTSQVDDVRPHISNSRIFINPIRLGSGMRRKVLEAWAMAKPVVSTTIGCEGYQAINGKNILIADNPVDFAKKVKLLMDNEELRMSLGGEGRATIEKYHNRNAIIASLERVYSELICQ